MRKTIFIELLLLLGIFSISSGQNAQFRKAERFEENFQISRAIDYYERAAAKGSVRATERLGAIQLKIGNYGKAEQYFSSVSERTDLEPATLLNYASLLLTLGETDRAIDWFGRYYNTSPADGRGDGFVEFIMENQNREVDSSLFDIRKLPFNSKYADYAATPLGTGLLFASDRPNAIAGVTYWSGTTGDPLSNLYLTQARDSVHWRKPVNLDWGVASRYHEGAAWVSPDTQSIYFTRSGIKFQQIMRVDQTLIGWGKPNPLPVEIENASWGYPCVSADGKYLYFASDMEGGKGGWDLYRVKIGTDVWGAPENLGNKINGPGNEIYPFIHPNGTLYFSSNGHPGFGGMDVFYSLNNRGKWSQPTNMELPLNSSYDDYAFSLSQDETQGYLTSNRDSKSRDDDIYSFQTTGPKFNGCPTQKETALCYRFFEKNSVGELPYQVYFEWDFGDGNRKKGIEVNHCFEGLGNYEVSLNLTDSITGEPLYVETSYLLEIQKTIQPYITCPDSIPLGETIAMDGKSSHLPFLDIKEYHWKFFDGSKRRGATTEFTFTENGTYPVQLGVIGINRETGQKEAYCVIKYIKVGQGGPSYVEADSIVDHENPDFDPIIIDRRLISFDIQDPEYRVQLGTSLSLIPLEPEFFKGIEGVEVTKKGDIYHYTIGRFTDKDSAFHLLRRIQAMGYTSPKLLLFEEDSIVDFQPFGNNWLPAEDFDFTSILGQVEMPDNQPIPKGSKIIWEDLSTGKKVMESEVNIDDGKFKVNLPKDWYIGYFAEMEGYFPLANHLDLNDRRGDLVIEDTLRMISIKELVESGNPIRLNNIFFEFDKHDLKPESFHELDRVIRFLLENPRLKIEIAGHTDNFGDDDYNLELSRYRAAEVARYLILNGGMLAGLTSVGYGESRPIVSNRTEAGRKFNRRVEFRIIKEQLNEQ